ncbi:hypothetical protein [Methanolobus sp. ZRKC5]|uniref:hypothetical protein n=1 Tax=unclassified Methanolobus TaxID=2629569 RepID=UPI00313BA28C
MSNTTIPSFNTTGFNVSNYPSIMKFTNLSSYDAFFTPFTDVWINQVYGDWWWLIVLFVTVGITLVKYQEVFAPSLVLLIVSAVLTKAVPAEVQVVLYLLMILGLLGVLYGWFEGRGGY